MPSALSRPTPLSVALLLVLLAALAWHDYRRSGEAAAVAVAFVAARRVRRRFEAAVEWATVQPPSSSAQPR